MSLSSSFAAPKTATLLAAQGFQKFDEKNGVHIYIRLGKFKV
jgi:hypothetical protein